MRWNVQLPVRIVPMARPELTAPAAVGAQLTYRGGPIVANAEVTTIFWGDGWKAATQAMLSDQINAFFDAILASALIDQLAEYGVPGTPIGHGKRAATLTLPASLGGSVDDAAIQKMIQNQLAAGSIPAANGNSIYFVYPPTGVTVSAGGAQSCQTFCGYHDAAGGVYYAVEPYPDCSDCTAGLDVLDAITVSSSHELCEAITDPVPGSGWYDDANGEIGDLCAWQTKTVGEYTVQLEWSNKAGKCV